MFVLSALRVSVALVYIAIDARVIVCNVIKYYKMRVSVCISWQWNLALLFCELMCG